MLLGAARHGVSARPESREVDRVCASRSPRRRRHTSPVEGLAYACRAPPRRSCAGSSWRSRRASSCPRRPLGVRRVDPAARLSAAGPALPRRGGRRAGRGRGSTRSRGRASSPRVGSSPRTRSAGRLDDGRRGDRAAARVARRGPATGRARSRRWRWRWRSAPARARLRDAVGRRAPASRAGGRARAAAAAGPARRADLPARPGLRRRAHLAAARLNEEWGVAVVLASTASSAASRRPTASSRSRRPDRHDGRRASSSPGRARRPDPRRPRPALPLAGSSRCRSACATRARTLSERDMT